MSLLCGKGIRHRASGDKHAKKRRKDEFNFRNNIICSIGTCFDVLVNFENQQHGAIADRSLEENKENAFDILSNLNRKNVSHYQLRIDMQEGSKCENVMSLEYFCSEYSLESECQLACGPGSQTGRCHWLPENRYND